MRIYGKHIDIGDSLQSAIELKINNLIEKYVGTVQDSSVTICKDHKIFNIEIVLLVEKGFWIKGSGVSDDPYKALDFALSKLEVVIKKHKSKLLDSERRTRWVESGYAAIDRTLDHAPENDPQEEKLIIAEQEKYVLLLSVSEAVAKLELGDLPVVMFKNADNLRINVVYKRSDGHIGWIDYDG